MQRRILTVLAVCLLAGMVALVMGCESKKVAQGPGGEPGQEEPGQSHQPGQPGQPGEPGQSGQRSSSIEEDELARAKAIYVQKSRAFQNRDIHFAFDESTLTPMAREILREKVLFMREYPVVRIMVEGHCDERGSVEYNLALGERRAKAAQQFMIDMGISPGRIQTISYGEERPVDPRHNEEAWAKNRRDHFVIIRPAY